MKEFPELLIEKHGKFFQMCLTGLPAKFQGEDHNKLALIFFCLHGLDVINRFSFNDDEKHQYREYVYNTYLIDDKGFRPSANYVPGSEYDVPHISATFFGLLVLTILGDDYSQRVNSHKVMEFLQHCQVKTGTNKGSFCPTINIDSSAFGESDLRICYMATSIRKMLKYDQLPEHQRVNDIDHVALLEFVTSRIGYSGGFCSQSFTEGHLGYTYCGLATLKMLQFDMNNIDTQLIKNFIVHRQIDNSLNEHEYEFFREEDYGALNGRENKLGDACYSWWGLGSLAILDSIDCINIEENVKYLLQNQHSITGGISKDSVSRPDPYHTFLALTSLALAKERKKFGYKGEEELGEVNIELTSSIREK